MLQQSKLELWEILVPCVYNDGRYVKTKHHKVFDKFVYNLAGGITILNPVKGKWKDKEKLYDERNIPVRIACTREQIEMIINFSLHHYDQKAIMAYKISEEVIIKCRNEKKN